MPLARIFTRNPERTGDLSAQLKSQGYKVEVASPDQQDLTPADLEIEFELCERADVLERAANLATELEADIAVAPGILQAAPEPKAVAPANITSQPELKPVAIESNDHQSDAEREFEAAFAEPAKTAQPLALAQPAAMEATGEIVEIPIMEHAPLPPVAIVQEPVRLQSEQQEEKSSVVVPVHFSAQNFSAQGFSSHTKEPISPDPAPYLAQLTPFTSPAKPDPLKARPAAQQETRPSPVAEKSKQVLEDGAKIAARTLAEAQSLATNTAASVRDHFQEYKKRAQVRSAEARAAHAARLLDLEQRQAEAQQRAAELEAARVAASLRLKELVQNRAPGMQGLQDTGKTEPVRAEQPTQSTPAPGPQEKKRQLEHGLWQPETGSYAHYSPKENTGSRIPAGASFRSTPPAPPAPQKSSSVAAKTTPIMLWRKINPPLRAVLTGAAAVSALFVMGIALGFFHSRTPLANTPDHTAAATAANATAAAPQPVEPPKAAAAAKPQPGTKSKPQSDEDVAQDTTVQEAKPSPRQHAQQLVAAQAETQIGRDVVIRRFKQPVPTQKPKQSGQQAGLKHFSDLDN